jgi:hypothetical protein
MKPWSCGWRGTVRRRRAPCATRRRPVALQLQDTQVSTSVDLLVSVMALLVKPAEELLDQQHHEQVLADDHAGGVLVGELRIEGVAELV